MNVKDSYRNLLCAIGLCLYGCGGGGSSSDTSHQTTDSVPYSTRADASLSSAQEFGVVTQHHISLNGSDIAYTATAGHLTAMSPSTGKPEATVFYVAYTANNAASAARPLTILYNGGPGSASLWLHMGSYGPKRIVTNNPDTNIPLPFQLVDNQESLLDTTDLVFVDPVGTGLSEAIAPNSNKTFWGVDADAALMRDFIARYLTVNHRNDAPLFIMGESYGTMRSAVLSNLVVSAGMNLKGVMLQSSILNFNSFCGEFGDNCADFIPSYANTGAWYNLDNPNPVDINAFTAQMRSFALNSYFPAVEESNLHGTALDSPLVAQLVNNTGLSAVNWQMSPNIGPYQFRHALFADELIGRFDARVHAPLSSPLSVDGDPSSTVIGEPFVAAVRSHLLNFLGYKSTATYQDGNYDPAFDWDISHDGRELADVVPDLEAAMIQAPDLSILSLNGYHDFATPFFQTELDLARLTAQSRITIKNYIGGHMTYLDDHIRPGLKQDVAAFIHANSGL